MRWRFTPNDPERRFKDSSLGVGSCACMEPRTYIFQADCELMRNATMASELFWGSFR